MGRSEGACGCSRGREKGGTAEPHLSSHKYGKALLAHLTSL
jgi:hypothetical protein